MNDDDRAESLGRGWTEVAMLVLACVAIAGLFTAVVWLIVNYVLDHLLS